ncbi:phospholipid:lipid A palmitoyltransferase [Rahnella sp. Lac-M11]|uniref:Lipid A acyltransferase PagP n=1 Tax=Rahnella contaminans TaxID=2703882 RepID=A0A6M2B7L5_9GAMM|nr:phospholipid:lipid A palmitoyltransferase [Rahnella contaminans]
MIIKKKLNSIMMVLGIACTIPAVAANPTGGNRSGVSGLWEDFKDDVSLTWNEPQYTDVYLPFLSWHNRLTYDKHKTDHYNEMPWGGGIGVSRYTEEGNWSGLFTMVFQDSHREWQPAAGYGWEKGGYFTQSKDVRLGLGLAGGITARQDFANYVPLPFLFPLFSAGYKNVNLQFTYIPGTYNNGNVLFAWLRYGF